MWGKLTRFCALTLALMMAAQCALAESGTLTRTDVVRALTAGAHRSIELTQADELVTENESLGLYYDSAQAVVKVLDKRNGYVFASGRTDETTEKLSKRWKKTACCLVQGEFIDSVTMNTLSETPEPETLEVTPAGRGVAVSGVFPTAQMAFAMTLTLEGDELIVRVEDESLVTVDEASPYRLLSLTVMPFFGASHQTDGEGYAFAPDGCGALIRFDAPSASRALSLRVYGPDVSTAELGTVRTEADELPSRALKTASMPVLGLVHGQGQNAVMLSVTAGEEYCDLYVNPMGNNNLPFCYACVRAVYNQQYNQQNQGREGFRMILAERERIPLEIRYTFLAGEDAGYAGMARRYRESLVSGGWLKDGAAWSMSVMIDCLMRESRKSLYGAGTVQMTSFRDVADWRQALTERGVGKVVWSLEGTADGGVSRCDAGAVDISRALGDSDLVRTLSGAGDTVLLNRELTRFYPEQLPDRDRIYMANRQYTNQAAYGYLDDTVYFRSLRRVEEALPRLTETNPFDGVAADCLARMIYSNFARTESYRRDEVLRKTENILARLSEHGQVALSLPAARLLTAADYAYDIPLAHSMLVFEGEPVPFVQMVLSGAMPCYTEAIVAGSNPTETLLRMIDFNCYPHYVLTEESSTLLVKTNSSQVFSSQADQLLAAVAEEYALLAEVLAPVAGQRMVDRVTPEDGVAVVTYESGARVAVNYNQTVRMVDGVALPALSARLMEKEGT